MATKRGNDDANDIRLFNVWFRSGDPHYRKCISAYHMMDPHSRKRGPTLYDGPAYFEAWTHKKKLQA